MDLAHFRMLIHELLDKYPDIVLEGASLVIFSSKSAVFMDKDGEDNKHTMHIARRLHLIRNGEKCK